MSFGVIVLITVISTSLAITTIHHDKPEDAKPKVMATMMKQEEDKTANQTVDTTERQKRLLPYMTFYLQQDFNRPQILYGQNGQKYQIVVEQKPPVTYQQQLHTSYKDVPPTGYQGGKVTPFSENNALPGPFVPMRGQTEVSVEQVPVRQLPNYSTIYDQLSQLKLRQQNQLAQSFNSYNQQVRKPQFVSFVPPEVPHSPTYEQISVPLKAYENTKTYELQAPHQDHVLPLTDEERHQYFEDQRYITDIKKNKPVFIVRQKQRVQQPKQVFVLQPKPQYYEAPVRFRPIKLAPVQAVTPKYVNFVSKYPDEQATYSPTPSYKPPVSAEVPSYKYTTRLKPTYHHVPKESVQAENHLKPTGYHTEDIALKPIYPGLTGGVKPGVEEGYRPKVEIVKYQPVTEVVEVNYHSSEETQQTNAQRLKPQPIFISKPKLQPSYPDPSPYTLPPSYPQTAPDYQPAYHPQPQPIPSPPTEDANSLAIILKKLQDANALPHTLTPDNIDNSIRTLVRILSGLKRQQKFNNQPIVVPDESGEYEEDIDNEAGVGLGGSTGITHETASHMYPENTPEGGTPGKPGVDYPALSTIPQTSFNCKTQRYKGFFGDPDTNCQVWHYCDLNGGQASFLCPNGTIFSQVALTCDWWYNVKCANTAQQYVLNERLYKYILPLAPKFPEDYSGPLVDRYLALKFQEMEEKMRKERKKNKENSSDDGEKSSEPETDDADELSKEEKKKQASIEASSAENSTGPDDSKEQ